MTELRTISSSSASELPSLYWRTQEHSHALSSQLSDPQLQEFRTCPTEASRMQSPPLFPSRKHLAVFFVVPDPAYADQCKIAPLFAHALSSTCMCVASTMKLSRLRIHSNKLLMKLSGSLIISL